MILDIAAVVALAFVLSAWSTSRVRRFALSKGMLDVPNARSSHHSVTPRGGGLAIVLATTVAWLILAYRGEIPSHLLIALVGGGAGVALIGFLDDRRPVPARVRFTVHLAAALWALAWIGAPGLLSMGAHVIPLGWAGWLLAILGIAWFLNLFNFMDGIDGIAASEAVFMTCAGAALTLLGGMSTGVMAVGFPLAASCCGFLLLNWPPAKIFMGDVGSGYLGYVIAVMALAATRDSPSAAWVWLILGGAFVVDATVTLIRRAARGERVAEAHRSHAYQWLARRWASHKKVTIGMLAIDILWLLPCAYVATLHPRLSPWMVLIALAPLAILVFLAGAGRREAD